MTKLRKPTYKVLKSWYDELIEQVHVDRINIHNNIGPERGAKESLHEYKERLKKTQIVRGYKETDYIISW